MNGPSACRNPVALVVSVVAIAITSACGTSGPLGDLAVDNASTGWQEVGGANGARRFVPGITLRLRNTGATSVNDVDVFFSFWPDGADGEKDSQQLVGVRGTELASGETTPQLAVHSAVGYTLPLSSPNLFSHGQFRDWVVKVFARRGTDIVPIGEFRIERRVIQGEAGPNKPQV